MKGLILVPNELFDYPRLNPSELLEMATLCPNLEELRLPMKRSMGDQTECEMYKALGTFSNLQKLFLDLHFDCRPRVPHQLWASTDFDTLRQAFINAAMDGNLALQIWGMIRNKNSRLKDLRILPFGLRDSSQDEDCLLDCFARSYLLTGYNLENPGVPVIEEIGEKIWGTPGVMYYAWSDGFLGEQCHLSERVVSVFQSIWPQATEETVISQWWYCWKSLPLRPDMGLAK